MKVRNIEMYFATSNGGGDCGSWYTDYVEIPADTPENEIPLAAKNAAMVVANENNLDLAFTGVYHIPELDDEINQDDWDVEDWDSE